VRADQYTRLLTMMQGAERERDRLRAELEALKAHDPLTCELCHAEGFGAELVSLRAENEALKAQFTPADLKLMADEISDLCDRVSDGGSIPPVEWRRLANKLTQMARAVRCTDCGTTRPEDVIDCPVCDVLSGHVHGRHSANRETTVLATCQVCGRWERDWIGCVDEPCPTHAELVEEVWVRQKAAASTTKDAP
jgi:hypothetical protein